MFDLFPHIKTIKKNVFVDRWKVKSTYLRRN